MVEKKKKKKKAQLPFRLNILFFIVFLMFSVLIVQLGVVQILNGEDFQKEIDRTIKDTTKIPVPRGKMYDRNYNVIVDNAPLYAITYTPPKGVQAKDRLDVAVKLSEFISMKDEDGEFINRITDRDKKDYWYLLNEEEAKSRITVEEAAEMDSGEEYSTIMSRITDEEISNFTEEELEVIHIKKELDKAFSLTPQIVKNVNVTPEEYAKVAEHLDELPGINATTDWDRDFPYGDTLQNLIGKITDQSEGILADNEDYYLTRGYSRNDRVGRSGLELQYEELLRGRKEQIQYTTKKGKVIDSETVVEGKSGKDLVLTVDMELQKQVDEILREELKTAIEKHPQGNRYMDDALAVMMNPKTGEILAISGQRYDRKENDFKNVSFRTIYDAHQPGSVVKGATILAGYESGVIKPGSSFRDSPIRIGGDEPKGSWTTGLGVLNDYGALRRSSNVYMFYVALKMGGENRYPFPNGETARFNPDAFREMRNYFAQLGLGVKTGIDYPNEATGVKGTLLKAGLLMDYAIGQYDTFTTLQLAQYVSTIANDGYRVRPRLLKEVREPDSTGLGSIYQSVNAESLNRVDMDQSLVERVQEGFRQVFQTQGGTAYSYFKDKEYNPAGKTGTAEYEFTDEDGNMVYTLNLTLVGYAPFDDPEVAFAVVVPKTGRGVSQQHPINNVIGTRILDAYFELKEQRAGNNQDDETEETDEESDQNNDE
ncbi:peptidoglycan D,D-transpeptidase FtsI family protein [Ornithinibacillus halophilus]|uniref:serine-type D-Ala-D-Ala carboxypeptidase n=1 Tax=Ornithinibacillus halophilus TaxID=930117 RepID=A0A1M5D2P1_9BACI|nr:penicillin-binding protein 2 [Ornithinibacillus halophilus]SHF61236.1 cell elongation-specific peptidoglycan D,D-transpeptidase [Ornithinibacillus halophilus]